MFIIALLFGVGQVFLSDQLIIAVNERCGKKIILFFLVKFLLYGLGIGLLVLKFIWQFGMALSGFVVGVPITAIGLFVYKTMYKK